ncbi:MAG: hypothetical protein GY930_16810, partial [bacterium]|nr:hypothetical protein [bacterium]
AIAATLADETRREAELAAQVDGLEEARVLATHLAQSSSATLGVVRRISQTSVKTTWAGVGSGMLVKVQISVTYQLQ